MATAPKTKVNEVNAGEVAKSIVNKCFGDAPVMREYAGFDDLADYRKVHPEPLFFWGVSREFPVCRFDCVPKCLLANQVGTQDRVEVAGNPGEFLVFQLVVWSPGLTLQNIRLDYDFPLAGMTCFNLEGKDFLGRDFQKMLNIDCGMLQSFWLGVYLPEDAKGDYSGTIRFIPENWTASDIPLKITVAGEKVAARGENDDFRMSRLAWLNSTIGQENTVPPPFLPLRRQDRTLAWLGHTLTLQPNGLPASATSGFVDGNTGADGPAVPLFRAPVAFRIDDQEFEADQPLQFTLEREDLIEWRSRGHIGSFRAELSGALEFDGYLKYSLKITAGADGSFRDSGLSFVHTQKEFFVGLSHFGGKTPEHIRWAWNNRFWQEGYWMGTLHGGVKVRLFDDLSHNPMANCYYNFHKIHLPESWYNGGKGGIRIDDGAAWLYSGGRTVCTGQKLDYGFDFQFSPFQVINPEKHWNTRIYHPLMHAYNIGDDDLLETLDYEEKRREGVNILNIHHAVLHNPIQNYPFSSLSVDVLRDFVKRSHREGFKVGIYYTVRQLSTIIPEFWAMWSLNGEIFFPGDGREDLPAVCWNNGVPPWPLATLGGNYLGGWGEVVKAGPLAGSLDIALQQTHSSRNENFYLEGLRYLLEQTDVDILYLDDCDLSRRGFQRMWRIFEKYGKTPALDFHAWAPYRTTDPAFMGRNSVILREMEKLPYYTHLWLGERFNYQQGWHDYYLVEISGLPFGLMSQMLYGGNPFRGLLFGMTDRYGWFGDPRKLWKLADQYHLSQCRMITEAEHAGLVTISHPDVHCTVYRDRGGGIMLALASWARETVKVRIALRDDLIPAGNKVRYYAPFIEELQEEQTFDSGTELVLEPEKGAFLKVIWSK